MRTRLIAAAAVMLLVPGSILADGMLIVRPTPVFKPVPMAVKYHRVKVEIKGQVATTYIDQVFVNPNDRQLEGEYIFPMPEDAAISRFSMFIDGKEMVGETLEADKARGIYEGIVRSMKDPALLEYVGRRTFRCRVFPIPARGEKRITLKYSQVIKAEGGIARYSYPLNTERFSSKPIDDVSIDVTIKGKIPIKSVFSPSHGKGTEVIRKSDTEVRVAYEEKGTRPDKDYVLYYTMNAADLDCSVVCNKPKGAKKGVFLALLAPQVKTEKVLPKDIVFVVDTSGSMRGRMMKQAKEALKFCVNGLKDVDRFGLVPFSTEARPFSKELSAASKDAVAAAVKRVDDIDARGGTNIGEALELAAGMLAGGKGDRPQMIVFLTDGEATVGELDPARILKNVAAANKSNARIFVFGLGNDLNAHFLDRLAEDNRGVREYVLPDENIEIKVSNFYTKVASPVLSDVEIDWGGLEVYDMVPARPGDIFRGAQIEIFGRYTGGGARAITVTGNAGGEKKKLIFEAKFPEVTEENELLPRLWAIRQVGKLMDHIRMHGSAKELRDEVIALAKEYGIMTPYTSMLVLEDDARRRPEARLFDRSVRSKAAANAPAAAERFEGRAGAGAVQASRQLGAMKKGDMDEGELSDGLGGGSEKAMKHVGLKTFYLKNGVWRDSTWDGKSRTEKVKYMSDEYFDLLKRHSKIGRYLAIGEKVVVAMGGKVYEIIE